MEGIGLFSKDDECRCLGVYHDCYSHVFSDISVRQVNGEERGFKREGERLPRCQEKRSGPAGAQRGHARNGATPEKCFQENVLILTSGKHFTGRL